MNKYAYHQCISAKVHWNICSKVTSNDQSKYSGKIFSV